MWSFLYCKGINCGLIMQIDAGVYEKLLSTFQSGEVVLFATDRMPTSRSTKVKNPCWFNSWVPQTYASIHCRLLKAIESPMASGNTISLALLNNFERCSRSSYLHCKAYANIKYWSAWMFSKDNLCPATMVCMTFYIEGASCKWDCFLFSKSIC